MTRTSWTAAKKIGTNLRSDDRALRLVRRGRRAVHGSARRTLFDGRPTREECAGQEARGEVRGSQVADVNPLVEMRRVKTPVRTWPAASAPPPRQALAQTKTLRSTKPGIGEWEARRPDDLRCRSARALFGKAYRNHRRRNACSLHYDTNSRRLQKEEIVLRRLRPRRHDQLTTDITRSWRPPARQSSMPPDSTTRCSPPRSGASPPASPVRRSRTSQAAATSSRRRASRSTCSTARAASGCRSTTGRRLTPFVPRAWP